MWAEVDKCVDSRKQCTIKIAKTALYTAVALLVIILARRIGAESREEETRGDEGWCSRTRRRRHGSLSQADVKRPGPFSHIL